MSTIVGKVQAAGWSGQGKDPWSKECYLSVVDGDKGVKYLSFHIPGDDPHIVRLTGTNAKLIAGKLNKSL